MFTKNKVTLGILVTAVLFCATTVFLFSKEQKKIKLPLLGQINNFELIDQNERIFHSKQLYGKVWIANFFFTTCSSICPMMTKQMLSLNRSFELEPGVYLVSISVNPETDSPTTMSRYMKKFDITSKRWFFLTGPRETITELAVQSFKLGDITEPIFHSSYLVLVDRTGFIRGYYDGTSQEAVNKLFKDSAELLKEKF